MTPARAAVKETVSVVPRFDSPTKSLILLSLFLVLGKI